MPELPEVETIKTAIQAALKYAVIQNVSVNTPKLRLPVPQNLPDSLIGRKIIGYRRIAKYIIIDFNNNLSLLLHLGMSGRIKLSVERETPAKHDHIVFQTSEGYMVYNDARRFGLCLTVPSDEIDSCPLLAKLGIDPFDDRLDGAYLYQKLRHKSVPIKQALLDQAIISGIGNIYASEALFSAGILPTRAAQNLSRKECQVLVDNIRATLKKAIAAGGSTLRDYRKPDGSLGYFQHMHCVYDKEGQPCPGCTCNLSRTGGIRKIVQGGRSTYFCETKQR